MDGKVSAFKIDRVVGLGETELGKAIVFDQDTGKRFALIAEPAIWFECAGLHLPHAQETESTNPAEATPLSVQPDTEADKLLVDLSLGEDRNMRVSMSPRAAQRLRDQLNGVLDQYARRNRH